MEKVKSLDICVSEYTEYDSELYQTFGWISSLPWLLVIIDFTVYDWMFANMAVHYHLAFSLQNTRGGSVVECLTRDQGAAGLSLTGVTALWSLSKTLLP